MAATAGAQGAQAPCSFRPSAPAHAVSAESAHDMLHASAGTVSFANTRRQPSQRRKWRSRSHTAAAWLSYIVWQLAPPTCLTPGVGAQTFVSRVRIAVQRAEDLPVQDFSEDGQHATTANTDAHTTGLSPPARLLQACHSA